MKLWNFWRPAAEANNLHPDIPGNSSNLSCPFKSSKDNIIPVDESAKSNTEQGVEDKKKN